jgi:hypothetical protein
MGTEKAALILDEKTVDQTLDRGNDLARDFEPATFRTTMGQLFAPGSLSRLEWSTRTGFELRISSTSPWSTVAATANSTSDAVRVQPFSAVTVAITNCGNTKKGSLAEQQCLSRECGKKGGIMSQGLCGLKLVMTAVCIAVARTSSGSYAIKSTATPGCLRYTNIAARAGNYDPELSLPAPAGVTTYDFSQTLVIVRSIDDPLIVADTITKGTLLFGSSKNSLYMKASFCMGFGIALLILCPILCCICTCTVDNQSNKVGGGPSQPVVTVGEEPHFAAPVAAIPQPIPVQQQQPPYYYGAPQFYPQYPPQQPYYYPQQQPYYGPPPPAYNPVPVQTNLQQPHP